MKVSKQGVVLTDDRLRIEMTLRFPGYSGKDSWHAVVFIDTADKQKALNQVQSAVRELWRKGIDNDVDPVVGTVVYDGDGHAWDVVSVDRDTNTYGLSRRAT